MENPSDYLHFSGKSGDNFVIPSVIQFLSLLNKSGSLSFFLSKESRATMYMFEGNLTHTELNKLGGIDVISHMFCWGYGNGGNFEFRSDYQGEKILYKSLGKLLPQQILMKVMQRNDECPYKKDLQEKFKSITTPVTLDQSKITYPDTVDPIRNKMIERLKEENSLTLSDLLTDVFAGEVDSCKALHELIKRDIIVNAENWYRPLPQKKLLDVMNIISKFTDQSIALKFLAENKNELELKNNQPVNLVKLKKLARKVNEHFTSLLPDSASRWNDLESTINTYLEKIEF